MNDKAERKPLSLSAKIVIGLIAGIGVGLFFGEMVGWMNVLGKAFVLLLQMSVLPYVTFSLISGLGSLKLAEAKLLAIKGGIMLLVAWVVAFAVMLSMPLAFPSRVSAAFFSTALLEAPKALDLLNLYIPANPFNSLANNMVPAVVLFSIATGVALIAVPGKDSVLDPLRVITKALTGVTSFVVNLSPYGIFAIAVGAAATMSVSEFERLQVYLIAFVVGCSVATFWILPGLISALTPFRYRDVLGMTKDAMLTAFSTGNLFVILPILVENTKSLFTQYQLDEKESGPLVDIVVPVSFNFPNVGKLMMMVFVLFAAWYTGTDVPLSQYPSFIVSGLVTFFGSVNVAIPFLLDSLQIPADMFQLFLVSTVVNTRFSTLLAAMHVVFLALTVTCAITGQLRFSPLRILRFIAITVVVMAGVIIATRVYFTYFVDTTYREAQVVRNMQLQLGGKPARVYKAPPEPIAPVAGQSRLDAVLERGKLRVGYSPDSLPFAYFNEDDKLVGLDVEMANLLATELGVQLAFVPFKHGEIAEQLASGDFDIVMSGLTTTSDRMRVMEFSLPYMEVTLAFVVRDYLRAQFSDLERLKAMDPLTIAIPGKGDQFYADLLKRALPQVEIVTLDSPQEFFESGRESVHAMLGTAESGSAWTLLYPKFSIAVPKPAIYRVPLGYAVPVNDSRFVSYMNNWVSLNKANGTVDRLYDYWILGKNAVPKQPRWSVIRDVLGWVK